MCGYCVVIIYSTTLLDAAILNAIPTFAEQKTGAIQYEINISIYRYHKGYVTTNP